MKRCSPQRFAAICVWYPQDWSFWHSSTTVGEKESDSKAVNNVIVLLPPCRWVIAVSAARRKMKDNTVDDIGVLTSLLDVEHPLKLTRLVVELRLKELLIKKCVKQ